MKKILYLMVACLWLQGCLPVLIGSAVYGSAKNKQARNTFITEFNKNNVEREAHGLPALDFCSEAVRFDSGWAKSQKECKGREDLFPPKQTKQERR